MTPCGAESTGGAWCSRLPVRRLFYLFALAASLAAAACASRDTAHPGESADEVRLLQRRILELDRTERALNNELAMARNPAPYLVVDMPGKKIELKASGRVLRSFAVEEIRRTGSDPAANKAWSVQEKRPLQKRDRPKVLPGQGEQAAVAAAQQELWGPKRMPTDFDLFCEGARVLEIRALPFEGSQRPIFRGLTTLYRRTADWWRHRMTPQYRNRYLLQLWLREKDSQVLFWSLPTQLNILVLEHAVDPVPASPQ